MRLKRDYSAPIRRLINWGISRFKPLSIHTELIMDDEVWGLIKEKVKNKKVKVWHIMTPANYELYQSSFNCKLSKGELSKIMEERYLWMKKENQNLQLHLHLSLTMKRLTYGEQEKLFKESFNWMKEKLGIIPTEFVPGWFSYNEDTLALCKKYNLKFICERDYDYRHDYEWII